MIYTKEGLCGKQYKKGLSIIYVQDKNQFRALLYPKSIQRANVKVLYINLGGIFCGMN